MEEEMRKTPLRRMYGIACHLGVIQQAASSGSVGALVCSAGSGAPGSRKDNKVFYARQGSHTQAFYMRQVTGKQVAFFNEEDIEFSSPAYGPKDTNWLTDTILKSEQHHSSALFGKPNVDLKGSQESVRNVLDKGPLFARPADDGSDKVTVPGAWLQRDIRHKSKSFGLEWFPRMDVVESSSDFVVTIELPGVNADGIHVEVNNNSLIVTGTRNTEWWSTANSVVGQPVYHRRELAQGPYRAVWCLPDNIKIDSVSAEFVDGFLRVLVPKAGS
eukprot:c23332_g1_i2 orf=505-1323(-)